MKKIIFLELFLRIIEEEKWNLFEKLGQLRTPTEQSMFPSDWPELAAGVLLLGRVPRGLH